jgi:hypothetical protein
MGAAEHTEQPMPVPNDQPSVQSLVRADLEHREQVGIARYGTSLQPFNGRDALRDLYEELLDGACYARQVMAERDKSRPEASENEPDYLRDYRQFWAPLVENPDGTINRDKVARELADYQLVMVEASKVYDELTGGRLSKPNTAAHHVINFANERAAADHAADLLDNLLDRMTTEYDAAAIVEYATRLHPDAMVEHERAQQNWARLAAQRAADGPSTGEVNG